MQQSILASLSRPLPDRSLKLLVVGAGLAFWLAWGAGAYLLIDGHPLAGTSACGPVDQAALFWECSAGALDTLLASTLNALIVLTLGMPLFTLAALIDPAALPLALPGLAFHLIGLPAGMFLLVRSVRRLIERA